MSRKEIVNFITNISNHKNISIGLLLLLFTFPSVVSSQNKTFIAKGEVMTLGDRLYSQDNVFYWAIEEHGTAVRFVHNDALIWGTNNYTFKDLNWKLQKDGNFCLKDSNDNFKWCSMVYGDQVEKLVLTNKGYLAQLDATGKELWKSEDVFMVNGQVVDKNEQVIIEADIDYTQNLTMLFGTLYFANTKVDTEGNRDYTIFTTKDAIWSFNCDTCGQKEVSFLANEEQKNVTLEVSSKLFGYPSLNVFFKYPELVYGVKSAKQSNFLKYTPDDEYSMKLDENSEKATIPYLQKTEDGILVAKTPGNSSDDFGVPDGSYFINSAAPSDENNISVIRIKPSKDGTFIFSAKWTATESTSVTLGTLTNAESQQQKYWSATIAGEGKTHEFKREIKLKKGEWTEYQTSATTSYPQTVAVLELFVEEIAEKVSDIDGDGVADSADQCPDVPGTKSNNGCPEVTEEVQKTINDYAQTILFEHGRSSIKDESIYIIKSLVQLLNEYPTAKFVIEGNTDNVGRELTNQKLSESRANAVLDQLTTYGVYRSRLTAIGNGETKPIASNQTRSGRVQNNRIEINLVKE